LVRRLRRQRGTRQTGRSSGSVAWFSSQNSLWVSTPFDRVLTALYPWN
jgi:hypothetical protein